MKNFEKARRHISTARAILSEHVIEDDGFYTDRKYVKMAGREAYAGVLLVLDIIFGTKKGGAKSIDFYEKELTQLDKKIFTTFIAAHEILHIIMGYDGTLSVAISKEGLQLAEKLIDWAEQKTAA